MRRHLAIASALFAVAPAALAAACSPAPPPRIAEETRGVVGVPMDGYPSYQERLTLTAINRARSDPNNVALGTASACSTHYNAQKPLMLNVNGSRAARFHCRHSLLNNGGLSHNSYCTLRSDIGTNGCDGQASCSCVAGTECFSCQTLGGCGTNPFQRAGYFGFSANGEVGSAGNSDGWDATRAWVTECAGQDGHRSILTGGDKDQIGLGQAAGQSSCWRSYYFGDTGFGRVTTAVLPSGAHRPERGAGATDFYVNYYAPRAAMRVDLVFDGRCEPMSIELGMPTNATYHANRTVGAGCHEYWFLAKDVDGNRRTYPESGSYGAGTCSDYKADRVNADCEDAPPPIDAGARPDADTGTSPPQNDAGPIETADGSVTQNPDAGSGTIEDAGIADLGSTSPSGGSTTSKGDIGSSCACMKPSAGSPPIFAWSGVLAGALALALRRRRSGRP